MLRLLAITVIAIIGCRGDIASPSPREAVVLPLDAIPDLLLPCTRHRPENVSEPVQPSAAEIRKFESTLPSLVEGHRQCFLGDSRPTLPSYARQYGGFIREGQRFLYINFIPIAEIERTHSATWRNEPVFSCDGGPKFFGVEFNVEEGRIVRVDFDLDGFGTPPEPCETLEPAAQQGLEAATSQLASSGSDSLLAPIFRSWAWPASGWLAQLKP